MSQLPVVLTAGDPSGIGPELAFKAWSELRGDVPFFLLGDPAHLPSGAQFEVINHPSEAGKAKALPILHHGYAAPAIVGQPNGANAAGVVACIKRGVELVQSGTASAICTNPISKKVLQDGAGFAFPGHTEFLADLAGGADVVMMLACAALRVVPATIHIPLSEVPDALTTDTLETCLRITHAAMVRDFGLTQPRIAVAGLNPHAGEGGNMGREDLDLIAPVLDKLRAEGMDVTGPLPADTMFHAPARAKYDVAVCMYHDQALIPVKTLDFENGVNVTLGLPFVRTSPDHGTAFDIAGKGIASPSSLIAALRMAHTMAQGRTT